MYDHEKALAIINFVDEIVAAREVDLLGDCTVTIYELHRWAKNHCRELYGCNIMPIEEKFDEGVAVKCGKKQHDVDLPPNVTPIGTALQKVITLD